MTQQNDPLRKCKEYMGETGSEARECGRAAIYSIVLETGFLEPKRRFATVYKCLRHGRRFLSNPTATVTRIDNE